jgi:hypothetical protein
MIANDSVTVTAVVRTDPATAFRIFTDEIDAWWKRGPRYRVHDDRMRFEAARLLEGETAIGRVLKWEPGIRLQLAIENWPLEPGEATEVEVRFESIGDGTRVTVVHRGWKRKTAQFRTVAGLWWGALLPGLARSASAESRPKV